MEQAYLTDPTPDLSPICEPAAPGPSPAAPPRLKTFADADALICHPDWPYGGRGPLRRLLLCRPAFAGGGNRLYSSCPPSHCSCRSTAPTGLRVSLTPPSLNCAGRPRWRFFTDTDVLWRSSRQTGLRGGDCADRDTARGGGDSEVAPRHRQRAGRRIENTAEHAHQHLREHPAENRSCNQTADDQ